jgi:adenosylhomocysteinase
MRVLMAGGAEVALCASNPLSTQDDIAAALVSYYEMPVYAIKGESTDQYNSHLNSVLDIKPHITMDDGMDLVAMLHTKRSNLLEQCGRWHRRDDHRRHPPARHGRVRANAQVPRHRRERRQTKHFFDNRYGTGQSTIDGIIRATNVLLAGKNFVVGGYGWCGKGIAMRATRHGRQCHRHRDRSTARPRSGDGWLPRHADGSRGHRPHLLQRHGRHARRRHAATLT